MTSRVSVAAMVGECVAADEAVTTEHTETDAAQDWKDVQLSLSGDADAYARLVRRYQPLIFRQMWRFTRDRVRLDELVQEVFVEAYFSLKGFQGRAPFLHWLRRIATRVGYRHWSREDRSHRVTESAREMARDGAQTAVSEPSDAADIVHRYLEQLSPPDRLVLTLIYLDQCGTDEIAARTGWSRALVRVRAHRARKRLRTILEQDGIAP